MTRLALTGIRTSIWLPAGSQMEVRIPVKASRVIAGQSAAGKPAAPANLDA